MFSGGEVFSMIKTLKSKLIQAKEAKSEAEIKKCSFRNSCSGEDMLKIFAEAGRVNSSILILDIDSGPGTELVKGVKKFKVVRPYTRIILLAPGRKPGDKIISQLLSKGIYDIFAPNIPEEGELPIHSILVGALEKEAATYGDAVRWDVESNEDEQEGNKKRETVYVEKIIGTVFICVVGARRGVGCTTTAVAMANYLASKEKKKVALVELNHYPVLRWSKGMHKNVDVFSQGEGTFKLYQEDMKNTLEDISCQEYDFIVLDMGVVFEPEIDKKNREDIKLMVHKYKGEILRANLTVMVTGSGQWDYLYLEPYLRYMEKALASWRVLTIGDPGRETIKSFRRESG